MLRGRLIPDTETPLDDGATQPPPMRAKIRLDDGRSVQAIVKRLPPRELAVECFCAQLLERWGIPTPPAALVRDGDALLFASLDTHYPSLKRRFGIAPTLPAPERAARALAAARVVREWDETPLVIAADEALGNHDRNLGNILWDGESRSYIDHAAALDPAAKGINKLAGLMLAAGAAERIERAAVAACFTLAHEAIASAAEQLPETWLECREAFEQFVAERLPNLANRVIACFPKPQQDLLSP